MFRRTDQVTSIGNLHSPVIFPIFLHIYLLHFPHLFSSFLCLISQQWPGQSLGLQTGNSLHSYQSYHHICIWGSKLATDLSPQALKSSMTSSPWTIGVPQGSILTPILFAVYINYVVTIIGASWIPLDADDTLIYASGPLFHFVPSNLHLSLTSIKKSFP